MLPELTFGPLVAKDTQYANKNCTNKEVQLFYTDPHNNETHFNKTFANDSVTD